MATTLKCETCGKAIEHDHRPVTTSGRYANSDGSTIDYGWDNGLVKRISVRCVEHPHDDRAELEQYARDQDEEARREIARRGR